MKTLKKPSISITVGAVRLKSITPILYLRKYRAKWKYTAMFMGMATAL